MRRATRWLTAFSSTFPSYYRDHHFISCIFSRMGPRRRACTQRATRRRRTPGGGRRASRRSSRHRWRRGPPQRGRAAAVASPGKATELTRFAHCKTLNLNSVKQSGAAGGVHCHRRAEPLRPDQVHKPQHTRCSCSQRSFTELIIMQACTGCQDIDGRPMTRRVGGSREMSFVPRRGGGRGRGGRGGRSDGGGRGSRSDGGGRGSGGGRGRSSSGGRGGGVGRGGGGSGGARSSGGRGGGGGSGRGGGGGRHRGSGGGRGLR